MTEQKPQEPKAADKPKNVSHNDLEKDLAKGNQDAQDYLDRVLASQGHFVKGDEATEQNDPKNKPKDTSDLLSALEVAEGAVEDKKD